MKTSQWLPISAMQLVYDGLQSRDAAHAKTILELSCLRTSPQAYVAGMVDALQALSGNRIVLLPSNLLDNCAPQIAPGAPAIYFLEQEGLPAALRRILTQQRSIDCQDLLAVGYAPPDPSDMARDIWKQLDGVYCSPSGSIYVSYPVMETHYSPYLERMKLFAYLYVADVPRSLR